jgi:hypothetical protein
MAFSFGKGGPAAVGGKDGEVQTAQVGMVQPGDVFMFQPTSS